MKFSTLLLIGIVMYMPACKKRDFNTGSETTSTDQSMDSTILNVLKVDGTNVGPDDAAKFLSDAFHKTASKKESIFHLYSARIIALDAEHKAGNISKKAHCDSKSAIFNRISSEASILLNEGKITRTTFNKVSDRRYALASECSRLALAWGEPQSVFFDAMMADGFGQNEQLLRADLETTKVLIEIGKSPQAAGARLNLLLLDSANSYGKISVIEYCKQRSSILVSLIQDLQKKVDEGTLTAQFAKRMKTYADYFQSFYCPRA